MTTKEKAKAYDEALERAQEAADSGMVSQNFVDDIFQLRESEDEKFRKYILRVCKECVEANDKGLELSMSTTKKLLTCLEKQKEQEESADEDGDFTIYHPLKCNGKYECIPYSFYGSLSSFSEDKDLIEFLHTCFYTEEECEEWIEKQKEQKPIQDESEREYIRTLKSLISDFLRGKEEVDREYYQRIYDWLDGRHIEQKPIQSMEDEEFVRTIKKLDPNVVIETCTDDTAELDGKALLYTADKSYQIGFRDGVASVKPVEWSEEDKTNGWTGVDLNRYLSCLQRLGTGNPQQPETINSKWFKEHCRPQPKQEWSEEDEEMRKLLIAILEVNHPNGFFKANELGDVNMRGVHTEELVFWLKFLRPQSKEELAKMLQDEYNKGKEIGEKEGYTKGYDMGYKDANESVSYHFPVMPTTPSVFGCDGTHCTNPHLDCINCPIKTTGGRVFNTASSSGDPTLKAEWKPSEQEKGALRNAIFILTEDRNFPKMAAQLQNILDAFEGEESRKDWKPGEDEESKNSK